LIVRAIWRLLRGIWVGTARALGASARAVGSGARELKLDPTQRRDGLGLAVLALALIVAVAVWWSAGGPVGVFVARQLRTVFGAGAAWLPPLLLLLAWRLVRRPPDPTSRGRLIVGWLAIAFGVLGIVHIAHGVPDSTEGAQAMRRAGGAIGYLASSPLTSGLTAYVAAPLLGLLALFGICVLTSTPIAQIPARLLALRDKLLRRPPAGAEVAGDAESAIDADDGVAPAPRRPRSSPRSRVGVFAAGDGQPSKAAPGAGDSPYDQDRDASAGLLADLTPRRVGSDRPAIPFRCPRRRSSCRCRRLAITGYHHRSCFATALLPNRAPRRTTRSSPR
jgi:S-DNA-T family DNA segregation ATPase FtsK/SpoIIIE